mmetsp:Transcript_32298/g.102719  ORF Transcript_32298/g.102719 Transcript_32298/m.102719 type:complete len:128 (+) Transcript_32298:38-421(+)
MVRGPKKHMKRLSCPSHWMLDKLGGVFVRPPPMRIAGGACPVALNPASRSLRASAGAALSLWVAWMRDDGGCAASSARPGACAGLDARDLPVCPAPADRPPSPPPAPTSSASASPWPSSSATGSSTP